MTPDTQRTPLTLEFEPDNIPEDGVPEDFTPIAVCEPSMREGGRIFLGVNPTGHRMGVHLLEEEARRIRDHLTKLLMEKVDAAPDNGEALQDRLARAVERAKGSAPVPKRDWFQFRVEFKLGPVQCVIGTVTE